MKRNVEYTMHIPDLFVLFICGTLFCSSTFSDLYILYQLFFCKNVLLLITFLISIFFRVPVELLLEKKKPNESLVPMAKCRKLQILCSLLGFGSFIICTKILLETYVCAVTAPRRLYCPSFPIFHISKENFSFIKIYCFINLALKSIPQLTILPIILLEDDLNSETRTAVTTSTLLNIVIFSYTLALTFPIRSTPRIFTSSACLIFNGVSKFMATACACCINLIVFVMAFREVRFYALSLHVINFIVWMWPCWKILKTQQIIKFSFPAYWVTMTLVFSFIYIHPFKGQGKSYYYFFYLAQFLSQLAFIYFNTDGNFQVLSYYCTLKVLMLAFISCFGLLNVLHKESYECVSHSSLKLEESANCQNDIKENNTRFGDARIMPEEQVKDENFASVPQRQDSQRQNSQRQDSQ